MSALYRGGVEVLFGVLGPVTAWDGSGNAIALKGPRHRAVLARLVVARGRVVPVSRIVDDLWADPPSDAVGAVRTFVAALRRVLEPDRPPRTPPRLLVTEGPGYALRAGPDAVDAWRFERAVASDGPPGELAAALDEALGWWRGPAYAEFADEPWARAEHSRLAELRLRAVERKAEARLAQGRAAEAIPDLDAHVTDHPWREDAWRLLALALYRTGRQGDALAVLQRARKLLVEELGLDPSPAMRRLEEDILRQADHLEPARDAASRVWAQAAEAYDRTVASGARVRLESTVGLLRSLAVTGAGGLEAARDQRLAVITAAEELGDAELTARVIGAFDVPAIWTRSDDPRQAAGVVAAAERALARLPHGHGAARARLLATVALESRGTRGDRGREAARDAVRTARELDDPALLAFALNGAFMQAFDRAGLAPRRDGIGAELVDLAVRGDLSSYEVLGHLIRLQARSALGDFGGADRHAAAADGLAERHERPLVGVFTTWYRALRVAASGTASFEEAEGAYRDAAARMQGCGMPGLESGLLPLALLCLRVQHRRPAQTEPADWGPYLPWARPLVLLARGCAPGEAAAALRDVPEPPRDLLFEALWCLTAQAAIAVGDQAAMRRARDEIVPAAGELAGAQSGLLTLGPVSRHLDDLASALTT
ncbi:BTAD domain-containing putative transcriptional regulator [Actinomadura luteofluorescens]|uniref:AfsR/SARP family transcriptional regulator n=1 Tax=Actinomadura luteofluorescens TaxID=46163 RepID=UPI00216427A1|nr:BTAD domain-containing putative transcriptional regulator [Actinomadura glauciflava]MCR3741672.1 DNA-binding transcriptional activator of the SARP family [Actinomadura glauciflava]